MQVGSLFGTDGIRGEAGRYPMDADTAWAVGRAVVATLGRPGRSCRVVVGKDTRLSGDMLEDALARGIASLGGIPCLVGIVPTPAVAFITSDVSADAGVVISASHNPHKDNGIKVFSAGGDKLSDEEETRIERWVLDGELPEAGDSAEADPTCRLDGASEHYVEFVRSSLAGGLSLGGIKVVLDTANGATHKVAPAVFGGMGAHLAVIHDQPDGVNINEKCGSQYPEDLSAAVVQHGAAVGLAFDGDGDRLVAVAEDGAVLTGDQILIICAKMLKDEGRLQNDLLVSTIMSNMGLQIACKRYGFNHYASAVGDRHVLEDMRRLGGVLGGEESGHIIFLDYHCTGDGILAGVQLLTAMLKAGKPLSELAGLMEVFPQRLVSVPVAGKPDIQTVPVIVDAIRQAETELGDEGRVLVRYSGTEAKCRVMVEAPTRALADRYAEHVAAVVQAAVGR
jgi:phosphoglucosamine mutase